VSTTPHKPDPNDPIPHRPPRQSDIAAARLKMPPGLPKDARKQIAATARDFFASRLPGARAIVDKCLDPTTPDVNMLTRLMAAQLVFEYCFGKPKVMLSVTTNNEHVRQLLDAFDAARLAQLSSSDQREPTGQQDDRS
jgi:hypothetical protein